MSWTSVGTTDTDWHCAGGLVAASNWIAFISDDPKLIKCAYCSSPNDQKNCMCSQCGAPLPLQKEDE